MKVTFTRGFDPEEIIKSLKAAKVEGLDDFVNTVSDTVDKLSQLVQKNITLLDNVDQELRAYSLTHGKSMIIESPSARKRVKAIIPVNSSDWESPITAFQWRYTLQGKIELRAFFKGDPTKPISVAMSIFH